MIGSIRGTVIHVSSNTITVETPSGVGYKIHIGNHHYGLDQPVRLFTYHHVREDASDLYGFNNEPEMVTFELLLTVSGVGPKMAQNILTSLGQSAIFDAVSNNQPAIFKSVSGVGQRVAEKIIVELKSKIGSLGDGSLSGEANGELFDALVNLGYRQTEVLDAMKHIDGDLATEEKLKQALRLLAK